MISACAWIRKGAAASEPARFKMTEEEYKEMIERARLEIDDARASIAQLKISDQESSDQLNNNKIKVDDKIEDDLAKFNLDEYDADSDLEDRQDISFLLEENLENLENYNDEDFSDVEDKEDDDDLHLRPTDSLIVACRTEEEVSCLEVHVYEENEENLYIHHDIMLPSFPLCVEWLAGPLGAGVGRNYCAVGTFDPEIEIWDLDILEAPYPALILGAKGDARKKTFGKSRKLKSSQRNSAFHTDAVMSLSWNVNHAGILASGSSDCTVKLWDINADGSSALYSFNDVHKDKVQALKWSPVNAAILATTSYDGKVRVLDCRQKEGLASLEFTLGTNCDPEALCWNPHSLFGASADCTEITVSDENGYVLFFDTRHTAGGPRMQLAAHNKAVTAIDWNATLSGCLLTASADRTIKIWKVPTSSHTSTEESLDIACVAERSVAETAGKVFSAAFSPDLPNLVFVAGSKGRPAIINLSHDNDIISSFQANSS